MRALLLAPLIAAALFAPAQAQFRWADIPQVNSHVQNGGYQFNPGPQLETCKINCTEPYMPP
jgi:hypothetical protein